MANATMQQNGAIAPAGPSEEDVRFRAYEIYKSRNGGFGDPVGDWLEARRELDPLVMAGGDFVLDPCHGTVTVQGETFTLTERQFALVLRLVGDRRHWVSGIELKEAGLPDRIGRLVAELPETIRDLVETRRTTCYRLALDELTA